MKTHFLLFFAALSIAVVALGCQEKPEKEFSEYGETISTLPQVENLPISFSIPAGVEKSDCKVAEEAEVGARRKLDESREMAAEKDHTTER